MSVKLKSHGRCIHSSSGTELPEKGVEEEFSDDVAEQLVAAGLASAGSPSTRVKDRPASAPGKE